MCGLVGFIDNRSKAEKKKIIKSMSDKIIHRGPDGEGFFVDNSIAMGFRRLSIIDLEGGNQPLYSEDENLVINFNGEVYNYKELREDLIEKGHIFKTEADTEVVLHGYEEYGTDILKKLRGMYGFAIWNRKEQELFLVRDIFGIKPMYYYRDEDIFMYGSEIKGFLPNPSFKKVLNREALKPYLTFQYSALEETFFKNVYSLGAGKYLLYKNGEMVINSYYEIDYNNKEKEALVKTADRINTAMEESILYHKVSDVEVGSFLSSGVDSSYIVSCANVRKAFTVGFKQDGFDETSYARDLCKILRKEHKSKIISADEFFDILPTVQYHSDLPHANLSTVPLYFLSKMASEDVKVVLSGEGADELFGGYGEYDEADICLYYKCIPYFMRRLVGLIAEALPECVRGKHFLIRNGSPLNKHYIGPAYIMSEKEANGILTKDYRNRIKASKIIKPITKPYRKKPEVIQKMHLDMKMWMVNDILLKDDKMTMANSLELRVHFLDKEVFEMSATIPTEYLVYDHITKYAFREASTHKIPDEWSKRKKKGFLVPFREWIKEDKYYKRVKEMFEEDFVSEFFDRKKIMKYLDDHYSGERNCARKIYTIYSFLIWYKVYFIEN